MHKTLPKGFGLLGLACGMLALIAAGCGGGGGGGGMFGKKKRRTERTPRQSANAEAAPKSTAPAESAATDEMAEDAIGGMVADVPAEEAQLGDEMAEKPADGEDDAPLIGEDLDADLDDLVVQDEAPPKPPKREPRPPRAGRTAGPAEGADTAAVEYHT